MTSRHNTTCILVKVPKGPHCWEFETDAMCPLFDNFLGINTCGLEYSIPSEKNPTEGVKKSQTCLENSIFEQMQECINRAETFYVEVLPQAGNLVIQDFENLNLLGMLLSQLKSKN